MKLRPLKGKKLAGVLDGTALTDETLGEYLRQRNDGELLTINIESTPVLSHAPFLRKGVAPELELHGTEALSIDRITGSVRLFRSGSDAETVATLPDQGLGNRFRQFAFPGLRDRIAGRPSAHPGLNDGYRIQLFTDAAARSAQQGSFEPSTGVWLYPVQSSRRPGPLAFRRGIPWAKRGKSLCGLLGFVRLAMGQSLKMHP